MTFARIGLVLAAGAVLAGAACTPSSQPAPSPTPLATPTPDIDRYSAPTAAPGGQEFDFTEAAQFDDGISIQIQQVTAGKATASMTGAEGTDGEIVTATIEVFNEGTRSVEMSGWVVQGYYGEAGVGAPLIADSAGSVGDSFDGAIGPGQEVSAAFAFAAPRTDLDRVTILVDRRDGMNSPVQFTGKVS